ncbi:MAG: glycosyltransferase [Methanomassiliicoccales archaeon]
MSNPLVSIIIPVYNGSDFLKEAIDSALSQSYPNFEVIVINDGSNDDGKTREITLSYSERITYLEKENGGVATALNTGIKAAKGKYISWLSHDDAYENDKLDMQVPLLERLESEGRKAMVYSSFRMMDESSKVYAEFDLPLVAPSEIFSALLMNAVFESDWRRKVFTLHGCTLLIPKAAFEEVGYFNESLRTTQDFDLWFGMLSLYDLIGVDEFTVRSRIHKGQGTHLLRNERKEEVEDLYLRAFNMYRKGSDRYDLDLPRAVLALKIGGRMKAYAAARVLLKEQGPSLRSYLFVLRASLATRSMMRVRGLARDGKYRIKKAMTR